MARMYLLVLVTILSVPVWAEAELFEATTVTKTFAWPFRLKKTVDLGTIEPAAGEVEAGGHEGAAGTAEGGHEAAPEAPHDANKAGKEEKEQKSFTGKDIGTPQPLPVITIGGKSVISRLEKIAKDVKETTPEALNKKSLLQTMEHRFSINPYAHNPQKGDVGSKITVIEMVDLACSDCMEQLAVLDAKIADYASETKVVHMHVPGKSNKDTNLPAFYGKIAERVGFFWEYRAGLIEKKPTDAQGCLDVLLKSGVRERDMRLLMMTDARRFYRELDADVLLARTFAVSKPPVVFVNGIRVGEGGVPMELFGDVMEYVSGRIARGIEEPGL